MNGTRALCTGCLKFRPACAFLDDEAACLVCVSRHRRQKSISAKLLDDDQAKARRFKARAQQAAETMRTNGDYQKRGPEIAI